MKGLDFIGIGNKYIQWRYLWDRIFTFHLDKNHNFFIYLDVNI